MPTGSSTGPTEEVLADEAKHVAACDWKVVHYLIIIAFSYGNYDRIDGRCRLILDNI